MAKTKTKKKQNLSIKSKTELLKLLEKTQEDWWKLKMDLKIGKLKDVHAPKKKRKEIARIKTVIRLKELEKSLDEKQATLKH